MVTNNNQRPTCDLIMSNGGRYIHYINVDWMAVPTKNERNLINLDKISSNLASFPPVNKRLHMEGIAQQLYHNTNVKYSDHQAQTHSFIPQLTPYYVFQR